MRDYLVIAALDDAQDAERQAVRDRLVGGGCWRVVAERTRLNILLEREAAPAYRHLPGVAGGLVGDVFDSAACRDGRGEDFKIGALAGLSPREAGARLVRRAFGRYLAVFTQGRRVHVLRDPMGAMEALAWRRGGLGFLGSRLPPEHALWPAGLAIDWSAIARILRQKNLASHLSPLIGVTSITPGVLTTPWDAADDPPERLWSPKWFVGGIKPKRAAPQDLAQVIDGATAAYAQGRERIICEVSGGLDSSIVAAALSKCRAPVDYAINHSWPQAEADERVYAQAVARMLGASLTIVDRDLLHLDADKLAGAAGGPRPNYVGGDPDHDADLADRLTGDPPGALFTGRGGDAVFFQMGIPELALDLLARRPCGVPRLRGMARLAERRSTTVWALIRQARDRRGDALPAPAPSNLFSAMVADLTPDWHPWLQNLAGISPAKRIQLRAVTNSLSAFGESQRHRAGDILDPLLAQPVVETCLALPAAMLAIGPTDRPFARRAFADRLPPEILARHGKGDLSVFYARSVAASLAFLRPYLMDGRLSAQGLLDRDALDAALDADQLIWRDATPDLFVVLALEAWVRRWEGLIDGAATSVPSGGAPDWAAA